MMCKSQFLIEFLIGDHERLPCAQCFATPQCFQNHCFSKTHCPILGDGADRLHIGIVRPLIIPAGAVSSKLAAFLHHRKAQFASAVGRQNFIVQHFLQLRLISLMAEAFPDHRLIGQIILQETNLANSEPGKKFIVQRLIQVTAQDCFVCSAL